MTKLLIFGREPAVILAFLAGLIQVLGAFVFHLSGEVQGALTAVVAAGFGIWTAAHIAVDKLLPAVLGFVQAGFSLMLAYGLDVPPANQATILSFVSVALGLFIRTQVVAKVSPAG